MQEEGRAVARKEIWMNIYDFEQIATCVKAELSLAPLDPYYNPYLWQLCPCIIIVILTYLYYILAVMPMQRSLTNHNWDPKGPSRDLGSLKSRFAQNHLFHPDFFLPTHELSLA